MKALRNLNQQPQETNMKPKIAATTASKTMTKQKQSPNQPTATPRPQIPPHPQRSLALDCYIPDGKAHFDGALTSIRAEFDPRRELVSLLAKSGFDTYARLWFDHTQTRAVLNGFRESLSDVARSGWRTAREPDFRRLRQFNVHRMASESQCPDDVQVTALPGLNVVSLSAHSTICSPSTWVYLHLTVLEAEALKFDLERSLGDMERLVHFDL